MRCGASTTEDTSATEPTGPDDGVIPPRVGAWERPPVRLGHGGRTVVRRVSLREGGRLRGLRLRFIGTEAQTDGRTVTQDGHATQHQGFQMNEDHCRPPATYG